MSTESKRIISKFQTEIVITSVYGWCMVTDWPTLPSDGAVWKWYDFILYWY